MTIERFADGKVVESWRSPDLLGLVQSLGAVPGIEREEVVIKARHNGPYKVTGRVKLIDADGDEYDLSDKGEAVALCRCGGSTTKPFCDGTHSKVGFQAAERAVRESL
ncbi:MAG: CDGSH iron-sulfur domain-containing protein [Thermoleophilaceae bacterium]|nr:CDGSH iron-sulfur domain-containing protein [Thermoleophilaceae bacterium]